MAGLPLDVKDMFELFGDIDTARQKPVSVAVLLDQSAPEDLLDFVRDCFASTEANARVSLSYYESAEPKLPYGCDLAVIAAAFSQHTGPLADAIRATGVPAMVVTTMPDIVLELASTVGAPLLDADLVSPSESADPSALPDSSDFYREPYPIDEVRAMQMRADMGAWVVDVFSDKKLAFALCFPFVRKPLALDAVKATSAQNAAVGAVVIIPGADMPVMTANQAKMILQIAAAYGQKMGLERAKELLGVVAGAFALRTAARQVVSVVPGFGWAVKGLIGYTGTQAMGHAAIAFFESTVGQGKPVSEALDAAKAEAERAAAIASRESNLATGVAAVAKNYVGSATEKIRGVADRAVPAAQDMVSGVAEAAGTTPAELGKRAIDSFCEATGTTPSELGQRVLSSVTSPRKKAK